MFVAGLLLSSVLAGRVAAQCDRAADCAASDPWFYQCTDGTRADYTDCANSCCAQMNSGICSDPVVSFDYYGCMDACSDNAKARCGTTTTPTHTTTPTTKATTSPPTSSPTMCQVPRAIQANAAYCFNSARETCSKCRHGVLQSNGKPVTFDGCGRHNPWWRKFQVGKYPLMTEVCNQHDRCFGVCRSKPGLFKECNDALLAGAYGVCDQMVEEKKKFCKGMNEPPSACNIEARDFYAECVGELVHITKLALGSHAEMCKAFNEAQSEFCKCSTKH